MQARTSADQLARQIKLPDTPFEIDLSYARRAEASCKSALVAVQAAGKEEFENSIIPNIGSVMAYTAAVVDVRASGFLEVASNDANHPRIWSALWLDSQNAAKHRKHWNESKEHWNQSESIWSFWIEWYEALLGSGPIDFRGVS